MISKWKVAAIIITTVAKMAFVSPAFAQSFAPEAGSGNIVTSNSGQTIAPTRQVPTHRSGLNAYAQVPRQAATVNTADPALNGGGSIGYNEANQKNY